MSFLPFPVPTVSPATLCCCSESLWTPSFTGGTSVSEYLVNHLWLALRADDDMVAMVVAMVQLVSLYRRVSSLPWILSLIGRPHLHLLECFFFCHVQGVTKCPNSATYYKLYYISIRVRVIVLIYILYQFHALYMKEQPKSCVSHQLPWLHMQPPAD